MNTLLNTVSSNPRTPSLRRWCRSARRTHFGVAAHMFRIWSWSSMLRTGTKNRANRGAGSLR